MSRRTSCSKLAIAAATFTAVICSAAALPRSGASLEAERGDEARRLLRAPLREEQIINAGGGHGQGAFLRRQAADAEESRGISGVGGDDESPEGGGNQLWSKDHEHEKEHHEGRDGEPVSKMAEEYMNKGKAMLEDKKAGFEAHKEALTEQEGLLNEYIEWHRRRDLAPTLDEMMQLPSANERWSRGGASAEEQGAPKVTVILNLFQREVLTEQLDSLFAQTAARHIEQIWVCVFSAPAKDYAVRVVDEGNYSNVHLVISDYNFKFYGRFQIALTAPSDFVWLVDDDMIPGTKYLAQLMHAAGTELMGRALLGSIGRVLPRPGRDMSLVSYRKWGTHGGKYMPDYYWDQDRAAPVDYLCSQWFLRPEWLQYMWSERPTTFATGEDFHISHTMRKYAKIGSYVMPYNANDDETKGSKYRGLSYVNAATSDSDVPLRDMLWMNALKAGTRMRWMDMLSAEESHVDPSALIIVRTTADVEAMVPLVGAFKNSLMWANEAMDDSRQWKLFIFSPTLTCTTIADMLQLKARRFCTPKYMRVFAPSGGPLDAWGSVLKLKDADPAAYEVAVTSNLREVMYTIKAQVVVMVTSPKGADTEPLTSAAMERVTDQAAATYNEWVAGEQGPVTIIKAGASDMPYLEFLPVLNAAMIAAWHEPKFSIHVITNDRISSLERLVTSLQSSHFLGDEVELSLHVDIDADEEMMDYIMSVEWPHGAKKLHHRIQRGGVISAVTESFHPSDAHSYAVFLEDDIEVSRGFYAWAKNALLQYRYGSDKNHPDYLDENTMPTTPLAGISLYTPRIEEVTPHRQRLNFKDDSGGCNVLLFQTPCSWGTVYFPEVWMRLHAEILKDDYQEIPGVLVNGWSGSWKKFLFSIMYHNDWYLLYPGYTEERSFATNHMEIGVHIGKGTVDHDPKDYVVPLFEDDDMSFWSRESLVLPKLEYLARVSMKGEITQEANFRGSVVHV